MPKLDFSPEPRPNVMSSLMRSKMFIVMLVLILISALGLVAKNVLRFVPAGPTKVVAGDDGDVVVRHEPLKIQTKYLDRADWPISATYGDAFTNWSFITKTRWEFDLVKQIDNRTYRFKVRKLRVELSLPVLLFLPYDVTDKLRQHEDGHLKLCRKIYDDCAAAALQYGNSMIGRTVTGSGSDLVEARGDAERKARVDFQVQFRKSSEDEAKRLSDLYDQATHHGLSTEVNSEQGVAIAIQKFEQLHNVAGPTDTSKNATTNDGKAADKPVDKTTPAQPQK